jgi:hypothetical protein
MQKLPSMNHTLFWWIIFVHFMFITMNIMHGQSVLETFCRLKYSVLMGLLTRSTRVTMSTDCVVSIFTFHFLQVYIDFSSILSVPLNLLPDILFCNIINCWSHVCDNWVLLAFLLKLHPTNIFYIQILPTGDRLDPPIIFVFKQRKNNHIIPLLVQMFHWL